MNDPTVFLVDDDAAIRDALSLLISLKGLRTAVFSSAESFLQTYSPQWRGCLLTDLKMPGMHGLELQAVLVERKVELPVVVLTAYGDIATTRAALKNGATDFLEKPVDDDVLIDVLRKCHPPRRGAASGRCGAYGHAGAVEFVLLPREREVLNLLAEGLQHRDIAERLQISPRTVEVYKARMMEKLHMRSLAEMVRLGSLGAELRQQRG